jgi:hypothetical protein
MRRTFFGRGSIIRLLCMYVTMAVAMTSSAEVLGQERAANSDSLEGVWNLRMQSLTERPTRGLRSVLLRIVETADASEDAGLVMELTNLRNQFVPVSDFNFDDETRRLTLQYSVYAYDLTIGPDGTLSGTIESPFGVQQVAGRRQALDDLRYAGEDEPPFSATRPGVIGHISEYAPPDDVTDPGDWVRSRISGSDDWALIPRDGISIGFTNADEFSEILTKNAGQRVDLTFVWVGEKMEIVEIAPTQ